MATRSLSVVDRALRFVLAPLEDPTGTARPGWCDVSSYQGRVNFDILRMNGFHGVACRCGISWGYDDSWFAANWETLSNIDMYRTGYLVVYPAEDMMRQVDHWFTLMPELDTVPRVIDLELSNNLSPARIADFTWRMVEEIERRDGIAPIIYTRYLLVNQWLAPFWSLDQLNHVWWWLAQYLWDRTREHPGPPTLPTGVNRDQIVLHQTADKKPAPTGATYSGTIDYDRWELGNAAEMDVWIQDNWVQTIPPPQPPTYDDWLYMECLQDGLRQRLEPNTSAVIVGSIPAGTVVKVEDVGGSSSWVKYTRPEDELEVWVNVINGNDVNMHKKS